jgi:hypothetical protein
VRHTKREAKRGGSAPSKVVGEAAVHHFIMQKPTLFDAFLAEWGVISKKMMTTMRTTMMTMNAIRMTMTCTTMTFSFYYITTNLG